MSGTKINSLTGMRFLAIMIIVISHLEYLKECPYIGKFYWQYIHNATIGVDFFFVLSGFGMMLSDINHNGFTIFNKINIKGLISYGIRHIKRIYPLYIFTIMIGIPLFFYQTSAYGKSFLTILKLCLLKLTACIFLVQSAFGTMWLSHAFNGVCWFLSCLFCIYLVSPIYINILKKFCVSINRALLLIITVPVLSSAVSFLLKKVENMFFDDLVYGSPYNRILYVVFGMLIAILISQHKDVLKIKNIDLCEIVVFILFIVWFLFRNTVVNLIHCISVIYIIDLVIAGLIVFVLAYNRGVISQILSTPKIVYLGELAMYIFLIHYPIRLYLIEICNNRYCIFIMD